MRRVREGYRERVVLRGVRELIHKNRAPPLPDLLASFRRGHRTNLRLHELPRPGVSLQLRCGDRSQPWRAPGIGSSAKIQRRAVAAPAPGGFSGRWPAGRTPRRQDRRYRSCPATSPAPEGERVQSSRPSGRRALKTAKNPRFPRLEPGSLHDDADTFRPPKAHAKLAGCLQPAAECIRAR